MVPSIVNADTSLQALMPRSFAPLEDKASSSADAAVMSAFISGQCTSSRSQTHPSTTASSSTTFTCDATGNVNNNKSKSHLTCASTSTTTSSISLPLAASLFSTAVVSLPLATATCYPLVIPLTVLVLLLALLLLRAQVHHNLWSHISTTWPYLLSLYGRTQSTISEEEKKKTQTIIAVKPEVDNRHRASRRMTSKRSNYSMFKQMAALTMLPYAIALICISSATVEAKVKITTIKVPRFVENGTQPSVVLDCPFTHDPKMDIHLVVKWFFNDDPEPIYQWITEFGTRNVPQRYEGKVNPNYAVPSNDPLQKHRALNLIRPTVELNGRYSCHVISIMSQDSAEATMIVYAKTKSIDLSTRRVIKERSTALHQTNRQPVHGSSHQQPQSDSAAAAGLSSSWLYGTDAYNGATAAAASPPSSSLKSPTTTEIECAVQNVYPLPELTIYQVLKDGLRPKSLENARLAQNVTQLPTGAFSVSVTAYIEDTELFPQAAKGGQGGGGSHGHGHGALGTSTIFECLVSQDEIRHEMRKRALYTLLDETDYDSSDAASRLHSTITQQMLLTLFICLPCIASILGSSLIWI